MVDVNLKIPALEKLMDYAASGIGEVAGSILGPWRARQAATVRRIEAEAEGDSLKLIADAQAEARRSLIAPGETGRGMLDIGPEGIQQRIEFQEKKRQANIASVVRAAATDLGDKEVPEHEPDPDWTARFFDCVQDVSSEDMKKLWSQVLSGEVESPGRTSLRTLDLLKNMTREDAELFKSACEYGIEDFILYTEEKQKSVSLLNFDHVIRLQDTGLLHASTFVSKKLQFKESICHIIDRYHVLKIVSHIDRKETLIPAIGCESRMAMMPPG